MTVGVGPFLPQGHDPYNNAANIKYRKVQVGKDQEKTQSEKRFPLQKPKWEKTKLKIRYLYHENIS